MGSRTNDDPQVEKSSVEMRERGKEFHGCELLSIIFIPQHNFAPGFRTKIIIRSTHTRLRKAPGVYGVLWGQYTRNCRCESNMLRCPHISLVPFSPIAPFSLQWAQFCSYCVTWDQTEGAGDNAGIQYASMWFPKWLKCYSSVLPTSQMFIWGYITQKQVIGFVYEKSWGSDAP